MAAFLSRGQRVARLPPTRDGEHGMVRRFDLRDRLQNFGVCFRANGAAIAQLVEHLIRNEGVRCSSHRCSTNSIKYLANIRRNQDGRKIGLSPPCRHRVCREPGCWGVANLSKASLPAPARLLAARELGNRHGFPTGVGWVPAFLPASDPSSKLPAAAPSSHGARAERCWPRQATSFTTSA